MFTNLSHALTKTLRSLGRQTHLNEAQVNASLQDIRVALIEADVSLPVITAFLDKVRHQATGKAIAQHLKPGEFMVKLVHDELINIMGQSCSTLNLHARPPVVILMAGLQGCGKTTTVAKLGHWLRTTSPKKSVMVTSTDIYRPAAIHQLETLANKAGLHYFHSTTDQKPVAIATAAIAAAKTQFMDVLIIDTAGRLHIDKPMMDEITQLHQATQPTETLFVVDSMTGQDATNAAHHFNEALPLTGVILTKTDGDARGGAALSVRHITGKPIKFLGTGEAIDALTGFHPDRIASLILGMGDIRTLIEEAERKVNHQEAKALAKKLQKKKAFNLDDFLVQLQQMRTMGGFSNLLSKLPSLPNIPAAAKSQLNDRMFIRMETIIQSMTRQERQFPDIINGSRKRRIAVGSGTQVQMINSLLKQFKQMQKMMKKLSGNKMAKLLRKLPRG